MANKKQGTGFSAPTIGTVYPKGTTVKRRPDGRIEVVPPQKTSKKK